MSDVPQARQPPAPGAPEIRRGALLPALVLGLACGSGALDQEVPSAGTSGTGSGGDTLPQLSTGEATTTDGGDEESGAQLPDDDPLLCAPGCTLTLPIDWTYEGAVWPAPDRSEPPPPRDPPAPTTSFDPRGHLVTTMLHDPVDDSLVIGEQRDGVVVLHRLDHLGRLEWSVPLPLPCDLCDLTHVARHPSGDLLLSANGLLLDRGYGLIAGRYDPARHQLVWATSTPLLDQPGTTPSYSGEIAALPSGISAQLYLERSFDFEPIQRALFVIYSDDGEILEDGFLSQDPDLLTRYPLIARPALDDTLIFGGPYGNITNVRGFIGPMAPPLWNSSNLRVVTPALDDLHPDARGHVIGLGHTHDGTSLRAVLTDYVPAEGEPRWTATLAFDSTTDSRTALAVGPDDEPYAAVRTTQALAPEAEPLVGLSLARWTTDGELRWRTTVLQHIDDSHNPVELAVDADEGLMIAAVIDDQLRVERRSQRCECGGAP